MAQKLFDAAEELGVNYFDLYASDPKVRKAVGDALQGRREKFIIQSHIGSLWENGQYLRSRNLPKVKKGFEEMMELLQTDYLDVGMIHYCDAMKDWQMMKENGFLEYVKELKASGRILHIGMSSHNPLVAIEAVESGLLEHHAEDCVECGACEKRCPFNVKIRENMNAAKAVFGY